MAESPSIVEGYDLSLHEVEALFKSFDKDGDCKVSPDELQMGLLRMGHSTSPGFVHHIFERADTDGDGGIDINEFKSFLTEHNAQLQKIFSLADVRGTGEISVSDLATAMCKEGIMYKSDELEMMMKKVDKDNSGGVSYAEFREYFMYTPLTSTNEILKFWQRPALVGDDGRIKEIIVPLDPNPARTVNPTSIMNGVEVENENAETNGTATAYGNGKIGYVVCKFIDSGAFGEVSLVECRETGMAYALKRFSQEDADVLSQYLEERDFFSALNNRPEEEKRRSKLVQMYDSFIANDMSCLLLSYVPGGNLQTCIENIVFTEEAALFYVAEAAMAINEIHSSQFVHRDIKPSQFLLEANGRLKLCDFGSCVRVSEDGLVRPKVQICTSDYMSPEVIMARRRNMPFPVNTDWWSLGVVLHQMLFGYLPFESTNEAITEQLILAHKVSLRLEDPVVLPHGLSADCEDLLLNLLADSEQRLSFEGICSHPALKFASDCFTTSDEDRTKVNYISKLSTRKFPAVSPIRPEKQTLGMSRASVPLRSRPPPPTNFQLLNKMAAQTQ